MILWTYIKLKLINFIGVRIFSEEKHIIPPINRPIGIMVRVFANCPGDLGSIPGRVIPKTQKMVLDVSLFKTQNYKVEIKGKVGQSREKSGVLP